MAAVEHLLTKNDGKVDGVLAAKDGLGDAIVTVLKKAGVTAPVTGHRSGRHHAGPDQRAHR